jgi:UDP-glucose 4-epimerase
MGETQLNPPNNLMPCVTKAMKSGKLLSIFGGDYDTPDGTAVRDFIHVVDLAEGHVAALARLTSVVDGPGVCEIYNMGNGRGYSVKEVVDVMFQATNVNVPWIISERRPGDIGHVVANPSKAFAELAWRPKLDLNEMCRSAWHAWSCDSL